MMNIDDGGEGYILEKNDIMLPKGVFDFRREDQKIDSRNFYVKKNKEKLNSSDPGQKKVDKAFKHSRKDRIYHSGG